MGYHPLLSRALKLSGDVPKRLKDRHLERAAIFLSNLIYWTPKSGAAGWVYKSVEEIEEETDLSRRAQDGARELLWEAGVLEERRKRQVYFRIRWGGLKPLLRLAIQARHAERDDGSGNQVRHIERGGNDRHVEQSTKTDMSSAHHSVPPGTSNQYKVTHHQRPHPRAKWGIGSRTRRRRMIGGQKKVSSTPGRANAIVTRPSKIGYSVKPRR